MRKMFTLMLAIAVTLLTALPMQAQHFTKKQSAEQMSKAKLSAPPKGLRHSPQAIGQLKTKQQKAHAKALEKKKQQLPDKALRVKQQTRSKSLRAGSMKTAPGSYVTIPYYADFSISEESMYDFTIINNNDDESDGEPCTWKWSAGNGAYYTYNEDGVTPADDYLVLPVMLQGGKTYDVTVNAAKWNYVEEFEVVAGTECTAAALTTTVIGKTTPNDDPADYSGNFTPATDGIYYIAIHATSAADMYMLSIYRFTIDVVPDAASPEAVSNLTVNQVPYELKNVITFTAPTATIGGETLTANITIDIMRNGVTVKTLAGVAPGSEQSYTDEVEDEAVYKYQVVAANAAGPGRKSDIVSVKMSIPRDVPYVVNFDSEDVYDPFMVIDRNGDDVTWSYSSYDEAAQYRADSDNDADDYIVTPALRVKAGKKYDVIVCMAGNDYNTERFEVLAGKAATAEELDISVIKPTEIKSEKTVEYSGSFVAESDGYYYVAVHAISDAQAYYLYVKGLTVELGAEPTAPAAPTLTATAGAEGELTATIQVTAPDKTVEGNALTAITKLELYRNGELMGERTDITPGATVTFTDENIETLGFYTYQAMAYNENGRGEKNEKVSVFIGIDQPKAPNTVSAVDHATSIDLSWDAVTNVGMNGGYVNPATVNYDVWRIEVSDFFVFFEDKLASLTNQTSTTIEYDVDEGDTQGYTYFAVRPTNEATENEDLADWNAVGVFTGKPYDSVVEGCAGDGLHYFWETNGILLVSDFASDGDGSAMALLADAPGQKVLMSGKLNLKNATHPMLVFDALNANNVSKLYVMGSVDQGKWQLLNTVTLSDLGYQTYQIPLGQLQNYERYAQIAFVADFKNALTEEDNGDYCFIDNIRIGDFLDNDLFVIAAAPATVTAGKKETIDVIVENGGLQPAANYTVKVMAGEKELLNETVAEELASFGRKQFTAELATTIFDEAGDVTVTVSVNYAADQNTENNSISGTISIEDPVAEAPMNLTAQDKGDGGVDLSWTAPEAKAKSVTEYFETDAGEFTQIDANGDGYGWVHMYDDELKSHSGMGGMQSYSWIPNNVGAVHVDNWIVTPRAILDGTFSFWASAQDSDWTDEHFAVYVSTNGNQSTSDFVQVSEEFVANGYPTEYTVDLSGYAGQEGYIAIRHFNSYDQFAMVIDDVTFTQAPVVPVKYNIYYEGVLAATVESDKTTYTVAGESIAAGERTFAVTAVYANGMESRPATATIAVTSDIRQIAVDGKPVSIYSLDGRLLRRQTTSLSGLKGAYIVGGKKVLVK